MDQIKSNTVARILEEEKKNAESGTELKKVETKKNQPKKSRKCLRENRFFMVAPIKFQKLY